MLDDSFVGICGSDRYGLYLDEERAAKRLPPNDRAAVLMARLGYADHPEPTDLRGDALVVGIDVRGGDCDVPAGVLVAACQSSLRVTIALNTEEPPW